MASCDIERRRGQKWMKLKPRPKLLAATIFCVGVMWFHQMILPRIDLLFREDDQRRLENFCLCSSSSRGSRGFLPCTHSLSKVTQMLWKVNFPTNPASCWELRLRKKKHICTHTCTDVHPPRRVVCFNSISVTVYKIEKEWGRERERLTRSVDSVFCKWCLQKNTQIFC